MNQSRLISNQLFGIQGAWKMAQLRKVIVGLITIPLVASTAFYKALANES